MPIRPGVIVSGGSSAPSASIVQVATEVSGANGGVTFGAAPTQGNLLVAIGFNNSNAAINGTGWNSIVATGTGTQDSCSIGWKVAGASESTTQTPNTTPSSPNTWAIWEILNGNPGWFAAVKDSNLSTYNIAMQTFQPSQLILGAFNYENNTGGTPSSTSGIDAATTVAGSSRTLTYFHTTPASAGAVTLTLNFAVSHNSAYGAVVVGI